MYEPFLQEVFQPPPEIGTARRSIGPARDGERQGQGENHQDTEMSDRPLRHFHPSSMKPGPAGSEAKYSQGA
jgi:hypothetical protein